MTSDGCYRANKKNYCTVCPAVPFEGCYHGAESIYNGYRPRKRVPKPPAPKDDVQQR